MKPSSKIILLVLGLNIFFMNVAYFLYNDDTVQTIKVKNVQRLHTLDNDQDPKLLEPNDPALLVVERNDLLDSIVDLNLERDRLLQRFEKEFNKKNPYALLGGYTPVTYEYFNASSPRAPDYYKPLFQIIHDDDYCYKVDMYNLKYPNNMFKKSNIFTDIAYGTTRTQVIDNFGNVTMLGFDWQAEKSYNHNLEYHFDHKIVHFFTYHAFMHFRHEIGKHFACATQTFNRIPGHEPMVRKDLSVDNFNFFAENFKGKMNSKCVPKIFPETYRIYDKEECLEFFKIITSLEYRDDLAVEPIQFVIKKAQDSHQSDGVFILDQEKAGILITSYDSGAMCGYWTNSLIAQRYIANPLLLNLHNKFDFRVYMLVASTNPLIAFYHDGLLRVALTPYDKYSTDRGAHLTNTHLAAEKFEEAREHLVYGMNEKELKEYHLWTFEELQTFLWRQGEIQNEQWLDDYLRPAFQKAMIYVLRSNQHHFWKGSNVYQLFGLDFMLDDNLKLWYIENNPNPQLDQNTEKSSALLVELLKDMFDIVSAYYRSRMQRVRNVVLQMQKEVLRKDVFAEIKWRSKYSESMKNKLEPEFPISPNNSWVRIINENLEGTKAYFGLVKKDCLLDD